jgi:hypothetical protein
LPKREKEKQKKKSLRNQDFTKGKMEHKKLETQQRKLLKWSKKVKTKITKSKKKNQRKKRNQLK